MWLNPRNLSDIPQTIVDNWIVIEGERLARVVLEPNQPLSEDTIADLV